MKDKKTGFNFVSSHRIHN